MFGFIPRRKDMQYLNLKPPKNEACSALKSNSATRNSILNHVHNSLCKNKWRDAVPPLLVQILCQTQAVVQTMSRFTSGNTLSIKTCSFCKWAKRTQYDWKFLRNSNKCWQRLPFQNIFWMKYFPSSNIYS